MWDSIPQGGLSEHILVDTEALDKHVTTCISDSIVIMTLCR